MGTSGNRGPVIYRLVGGGAGSEDFGLNTVKYG